MQNSNRVICPNCETEYLPGEVFLPKQFLGQPKEVERDITGKVIYNDGIDQDLEEDFVCVKCGKQFHIKASITYETSIDKKKDMTEDYVSEKYGDRIFLKED